MINYAVSLLFFYSAFGKDFKKIKIALIVATLILSVLAIKSGDNFGLFANLIPCMKHIKDICFKDGIVKCFV